MDHKCATVSTSFRGLLSGVEDLLLILCHSDPFDPNKSTEQILAIYPILPGQKPKVAHAIPPRQSTHEAAAPQPKQDDLIDFGQDDGPADTQRPPMPPSGGDPTVESSGEISEMLKATGKPSEGPLIDLHDDLKNSLTTMKKEDTSGSTDTFMDAKE